MDTRLPDPIQGQRTLAAIMVTDAVGFSARMSLDEEHTLQLIHRDLKLIGQLCKQYEGKVLKSTGDGLLMYFVSAVQAVNCALEIQKQLTQLNQTKESDLLHRIGIHLGDVFFSESDVMGNGVNIAARLQTQALPGGICISQVLYDVVKSRLALNAQSMGPLKLKNIHEPVVAFQLLPGQAVAPQPAAATLLQETLAPTHKIAGRYTIKQVLGQGGFGISYLVEDNQRFGECCVLKEFKPAQGSPKSIQKAIDLFKREAKTLYQINHPQIPKFLACFTQAQRLFIVIEYIDGVTYLKMLQQRKREGKLFTEAEILPWLMQMLQVLDYLHSLKIMHRDISPENIMFSQARNLPVLIDFGLVNDAVSDLLLDDAADSEAKHSATVAGKFGYSPPEQLRLGRCYPSSDLYALGVTTLVLLSGKHPQDLMDRDSLEWSWPQSLKLSPQLRNLLLKMTQHRPGDRFQSSREVMQALAAAFPGQVRDQVVPPPPPRPLPTPPPITAPLGSPLGAYDATFITQCREELSRCIGPMADIVIEDTLAEHPNASPQELVKILATHLSNADQVSVFISHIRIPDERATTLTTKSLNLPTAETALETALQTTSQGGIKGTANATIDGIVQPNFINQCRQALTRCIGPMADMILEDILVDYPDLTARALVERLATEIPDPQKALEFRRQLTTIAK